MKIIKDEQGKPRIIRLRYYSTPHEDKLIIDDDYCKGILIVDNRGVDLDSDTFGADDFVNIRPISLYKNTKGYYVHRKGKRVYVDV